MIKFKDLLFDGETIELLWEDVDSIVFSDGFFWVTNTDGLMYKAINIERVHGVEV